MTAALADLACFIRVMTGIVAGEYFDKVAVESSVVKSAVLDNVVDAVAAAVVDAVASVVAELLSLLILPV